MGIVIWEVKFEKELPSFSAIKSRFHSQTGLRLSLKADLYLTVLKTSSAGIFQLLQQDAPAVAELEREKEAFYKAHAQQYEKMAQFRDLTAKKITQLSSIGGVQFTIDGFYVIDFQVKENTLVLETYVGQEQYGIKSLIKVLIDLGGKLGGRFIDSDGNMEGNYPKSWHKLKKWHQYKWYNRPRK